MPGEPPPQPVLQSRPRSAQSGRATGVDPATDFPHALLLSMVRPLVGLRFGLAVHLVVELFHLFLRFLDFLE
jgi:hypothetical protein